MIFPFIFFETKVVFCSVSDSSSSEASSVSMCRKELTFSVMGSSSESEVSTKFVFGLKSFLEILGFSEVLKISVELSTALAVTRDLNNPLARYLNQDFAEDFGGVTSDSTNPTGFSHSFAEVGVGLEGVVQDKVAFGGSELAEMIGERGRESTASV